MTATDKDMIKAMAVMKEYCKNVKDSCRICPMFDNCDGSDDKRFPYFWYIPEV